MADEPNRSAAARRSPASSIEELLRDLQPMGDLRPFMIDDLTPDEKDAFFRILEEA